MSTRRYRNSTALGLVSLLLAGTAVLAQQPQAADPTKNLTPVTDAMLRNPPAADWLMWRRTYDGYGYSPLEQINKGNVKDLQLAWSWSLTSGATETTPIVHDGVLYIFNFGNKIQALNAATGDLIWEYKRDLPAKLIAEDPVLAATGRFLWPIPHATVTQGFGPTPYVFEASYAGFPHFHTGIDLAVPLGTPVFAAADGVVVLARPMADTGGLLVGYGNYVIIQHDAGLKTLYGHLMAIGAKEGDQVKRGQLIGLVGSTGNSTGPHTHFEVRIDNSPIDPLQMLPH